MTDDPVTTLDAQDPPEDVQPAWTSPDGVIVMGSHWRYADMPSTAERAAETDLSRIEWLVEPPVIPKSDPVEEE